MKSFSIMVKPCSMSSSRPAIDRPQMARAEPSAAPLSRDGLPDAGMKGQGITLAAVVVGPSIRTFEHTQDAVIIGTRRRKSAGPDVAEFWSSTVSSLGMSVVI